MLKTVKGHCTHCGYQGEIKVPYGQKATEPNLLQIATMLGGGTPVRCPSCGYDSCYEDK